MSKCVQCGYKNDERAESCNLCGAKLRGGASGGGGGAGDVAMHHEPRLWSAGRPRARQERSAAAGGTATENVETERHYLVPPTGEPLALAVGSTLSIGREEACDVCVVSPKVSRRHAEVRWIDQPPRPLLKDLGSQNGTYVNDRRLESHGEYELSDGDIVRVGDLSATYRFAPPGTSAESLKKEMFGNTTSVMPSLGELEKAKEEAAAGTLTGDAAILPIGEVLRRLGPLHAHGTLHVEAGGASGHVLIEDGRPIAGNFAGLEGAPAIAAIGSLNVGRFRFEPSEVARASSRPTEQLDKNQLKQKLATPPPPAPAKAPPTRPLPGHATDRIPPQAPPKSPSASPPPPKPAAQPPRPSPPKKPGDPPSK